MKSKAIVTIDNVNQTLVNAERLNDYLSSNTAAQSNITVTMLPTIVKSFCDMLVNFAKIAEQHRETTLKAKIINKYLDCEHQTAIRKDHLALKQMQENSSLRHHELDVQLAIQLARIDADKDTAIRKIASAESTELVRLHSEYELARIEQELQMKQFNIALRADMNRWKDKMKYKQRISDEIHLTLDSLRKRLDAGEASENEIMLIESLSKILLELYMSNDVADSFLTVFIGGRECTGV